LDVNSNGAGKQCVMEADIAKIENSLSTYNRGVQLHHAYAVCPYCLVSKQLDRVGRMVRHGWNAHNVKHGERVGYHTGSCPGVETIPLNQSDLDGVKAALSWRKEADGWRKRAKRHREHPYETYSCGYRRYVGHLDTGREGKIEAMEARIERVPGVSVRHRLESGRAAVSIVGRFKDYGEIEVEISRDYDPTVKYPYRDEIPIFHSWDALRASAIGACLQNSDACRKQADKIDEACAWHRIHDTTPLEVGVRPATADETERKLKRDAKAEEMRERRAAKAEREAVRKAKRIARYECMEVFIEGLKIGTVVRANTIRAACKAAGLGKATENEFGDAFGFHKPMTTLLERVNDYSDEWRRV